MKNTFITIIISLIIALSLTSCKNSDIKNASFIDSQITSQKAEVNSTVTSSERQKTNTEETSAPQMQETSSKKEESSSIAAKAQKQEKEETLKLERPLITMEEEVINLLNAEREKKGLPHLIADNIYYNKVMLRAQECEEYWSHTRPNGEKWSTVYWGLTNERIKMVAENLARNFITPESIVKALMESEAHRNNILNEKFTHVCIAINTMALQDDYPDYTLYSMAQHFYQEEE